ncbi:EAL domain-containing protein [Aromatoleum evansii]|uniref:EAL domain-containing protein n=1 Tax=Aromatoleum evansii TaxID=59406 RepID=A0ABZ1AVW3_AROEV|nr:Phytochrome-like protein cph2 [Azoarcus sp. Aa7]WRL48806.1 EAL domain-containing protein [Aromatoleum evansii]
MTRVLLLLAHRRNRRLLAEWLAPHYQVVVGESAGSLGQPFDLGIVDGPALERLRDAIAARKEREQPILLPFLFVTARRGAGLGTQQLWQTVDEVIATPIEKAELQVRLQVLARMRKLSLDLRTTHEAQLRHMALHDPLTDLPNRYLFSERLGAAVARARADRRSLAVLLLDLDRFNAINESFGHAYGDLLLQAVAARLAACLPRDTLAHFGGDSFAAFLPEFQHLREPVLVAERLLAALSSQPFELVGHTVYATASVGITLFPEDAGHAAALLENADTALYRAKGEGGGTYQFYTPQMKTQVLDRLNLETRLRGAVERGELVLEYQPQVDIASGDIVGFEALARWDEPELGRVAPTRFIPIAEETGLVESIGEWALAAACRQNKAWQQAGLPPLRAAVNVSARQFRHGVEKIVARVLAETGLDPCYLELEITESSLMECAPESMEVLRKLRGLGVQLSIDDFGTGYSAMSYLKRLPVATLKIDRSFVSDIAHDADSVAIVRAIVAVAHSLKLKVIAEGVETVEQLENLRAHGCDEVQGFVVGRPVPAADFAQPLRRRRAEAWDGNRHSSPRSTAA